MNNEIVQLTEQLIAAHLWKAIFIFISSFVSISLIKQLAGNIFEYISLKIDVFGHGSLIYYNGKKATIKNLGLKRTDLYLIDTKETITIRTLNWRKFELIKEDAKKKI